ncbi:electron transfer flavoprotein subunit beta/FixA family protein [Nocardioides zhouii]|uniref:Electron transfer flavoprotein subunit beta n=1 Tax=Nocardioides zhouii TaxID=1168729 RepID=A0A4Q2SPA9_9ACTN|nr:electron transfer flavoprotein subunit beta/FixA family protein [Nocardioides zhouii]RYC05928.1 electron transfer flavoprotein subunit beta/FixA family protein [Nocardioides zhouii]
MKVVVCVTQVLDVSPYLEFTADGTSVDPAFATVMLNGADENAIEAGLALCDEAGGGEVVLVSVGADEADQALRSGLTMGPQRAVRVWSDGLVVSDPGSLGAALAHAMRVEEPDLVLAGVQVSDTGGQSTGPALAAAWGVPCVPVARDLHVVGGTLTATREFEAGVTEIVQVDLPAVVTVQVGANEPRYGTFKEKMRAKKAEIPLLEPVDLPPVRSALTTMVRSPGDSARSVRMIEGGPADIAATIITLIREAQ